MGIKRWGRRNADVSATVTSSRKDPSAADLIPRLKVMREVWSHFENSLERDPQGEVYYVASYGSRFEDDRMPQRGKKGKKQFGDAFGGGYHGRVQMKPANRRFSLNASRPYMPGLSNKWINDDLIPTLENWWIDGDPDGDLS